MRRLQIMLAVVSKAYLDTGWRIIPYRGRVSIAQENQPPSLTMGGLGNMFSW